MANLLDDSISHQDLLSNWMIDGGLGIVSCIFQFPCVLSLVMQQLGIVISLVEKLQDSGEYLRMFIWQVDSSLLVVKELALDCGFEEGGSAQDVLMTSKDSLFTSNADRDDSRGEGTGGVTGQFTTTVLLSEVDDDLPSYCWARLLSMFLSS